MTQEATFKKVGQSDQRMYGEPGLLICGYTADQHQNLVKLLEQIDLATIPLIFLNSDYAEYTLKKAFSLPDRTGYDVDSDLPASMIMSGFSESELHKLISSYRKLGLPNPLWASLTPISENWKLSDLLNELKAEREAFIKRQKNQSKS